MPSRDIDLCRDLVGMLSDVDTRGSNGRTLLHVALAMADYRLAELLLDRGADALAVTPYGESPLYVASTVYGNQETVVRVLRRLLDAGNSPNETHSRPLLHSNLASHAVTALLLERGADPNATDSDDRTALHVLCQYYKNDANIPTYDILLERVDPNARDYRGFTPLHYLLETSHGGVFNGTGEVILEKLLAHPQIDPNLHDKQGNTPLDLTRKPATISLLRQRGAVCNNKVLKSEEHKENVSPRRCCIM